MEEMYVLSARFNRGQELLQLCNNLVELVIVASCCTYTDTSKKLRGNLLLFNLLTSAILILGYTAVSELFKII
jgi:hypothetical protein